MGSSDKLFESLFFVLSIVGVPHSSANMIHVIYSKCLPIGYQARCSLFNICSNLYVFVFSDYENCFTIGTYKIYSNGVNSPTVIKLSSTKSFFKASYYHPNNRQQNPYCFLDFLFLHVFSPT